MDVMMMGDIEHFDTANISAADIERLRSLLPAELQQHRRGHPLHQDLAAESGKIKYYCHKSSYKFTYLIIVLYTPLPINYFPKI